MLALETAVRVARSGAWSGGRFWAQFVVLPLLRAGEATASIWRLAVVHRRMHMARMRTGGVTLVMTDPIVNLIRDKDINLDETETECIKLGLILKLYSISDQILDRLAAHSLRTRCFSASLHGSAQLAHLRRPVDPHALPQRVADVESLLRRGSRRHAARVAVVRHVRAVHLLPARALGARVALERVEELLPLLVGAGGEVDGVVRAMRQQVV